MIGFYYHLWNSHRNKDAYETAKKANEQETNIPSAKPEALM